MPDMRAHTYVDVGRAHAGTPWSLRCWSAFLGNTVSLQDVASGREWLARPSDEIDLIVDGRRLSLMDFQGGDWSEECNPYGAVLNCQLTGPGLTVFVRSIAMHHSPGMLRELRLLNRSGQPMAVTECVLDHFPLALAARRGDLFRRVSEKAIVADDGTGALLIGHNEEVAVQVNAERTPEVTLRCRGSYMLVPGQIQKLPDTSVLPYTGPFENISGHGLATFLRAVRDMREWDQQTRTTTEGMADRTG